MRLHSFSSDNRLTFNDNLDDDDDECEKLSRSKEVEYYGSLNSYSIGY